MSRNRYDRCARGAKMQYAYKEACTVLPHKLFSETRAKSAQIRAMHGYKILPMFVSIAHDACEASALFRHALGAAQ